VFLTGCQARHGDFAEPLIGKLRREENAMKTLVSTIALGLALAFTGPAFAGDVTTAKNQADCEKAGGMWDTTSKMCSEKKM
jgi:hypothetical protein